MTRGPSTDALRATVSEAGVAKPDSIVEVHDLQRSFGGLRAVAVDHLEIQRGAITAIIGPNGAGKTTLFNLLTGFDRPDSGWIRLVDQEIQNEPPHRIALMGMVRTFQLTRTLDQLTLLENVMLAAPEQRGERLRAACFGPVWRSQETGIREEARELLGWFSLADKEAEPAGSLSGGQRKLLEVARALMARSLVILLDEPMAGVNPALTESLLEHLLRLPGEFGTTLVFVEHDMDVVAHVSDWVVCMAEGRVIAEGPSDVVSRKEEVIDAYLGSDIGGDEGGL